MRRHRNVSYMCLSCNVLCYYYCAWLLLNHELKIFPSEKKPPPFGTQTTSLSLSLSLSLFCFDLSFSKSSLRKSTVYRDHDANIPMSCLACPSIASIVQMRSARGIQGQSRETTSAQRVNTVCEGQKGASQRHEEEARGQRSTS